MLCFGYENNSAVIKCSAFMHYHVCLCMFLVHLMPTLHPIRIAFTYKCTEGLNHSAVKSASLHKCKKLYLTIDVF